MGVGGILLGVALLLIVHPSHKEHHDGFYKHLKRKDGVSSCCSNKDCRRADDWRMTPSGKYHIQIDGLWIMPPQYIIQHKQTPDGEAHACFDTGKAHIDGQKTSQLSHPHLWSWYCLIIPITST